MMGFRGLARVRAKLFLQVSRQPKDLYLFIILVLQISNLQFNVELTDDKYKNQNGDLETSVLSFASDSHKNLTQLKRDFEKQLGNSNWIIVSPCWMYSHMKH